MTPTVLPDFMATPAHSASFTLPFTKMHGLGNDFVMVKDSDLAALLNEAEVDARRLSVALSKLAKAICDRRFGVGADGLIAAISLSPKKIEPIFQELLETYPSFQSCDMAWIYINSDGSSAEMCGNGLRCLAYFATLCALENARESAREDQVAWPQSADFTVATSVYPVNVKVDLKVNPQLSSLTALKNAAATGGGAANSTAMVRTTLAGPEFDKASALGKFVGQKLPDIALSATAVNMGNPHCVIFDCPELNLAQYQGCMQGISAGDSSAFIEKFPLKLIEIAHKIQSLSLFPSGVNVEFVMPQGRDRAQVYVVERGCGPTLACASGAAAVVAAGVIEERLNRQCCVILPGGELEVAWSSLDNHIELNGPAQISFAGLFSVSRDSFLSSDFSMSLINSQASSQKEVPA